MAVYFSPVGNDQQFDANGNPLVAGYWEVFLAGTTTPITTYTSNTGVTPQPAQITLDAAGRPANPIWITGGIPVKFRLSNASAVVQLTIDNVSGINDPSATVLQDQWLVYGAAPTYLTATTFSVAGDQTGTFQVGRRIKTTNTGGIVYGTITASVYGAVTIITVLNDSGALDSGLSSVSYGLLSATNKSIPDLGTQTNDNAAAGKIGEYQSAELAVGSAFGVLLANSGTTNTPTGVQLALTPGDWEVWFVAATAPVAGTVTQQFVAHLDTSAAGTYTIPNGGGVGFISTPATANAAYTTTGRRRYSLAASATVYLRVRVDFTVSNMQIYGGIYARRMR